MGIASLPRLRSLTLTLTERCTLRCAYCHTPKERGRAMPERLIDASVDLLAKHADGPVTMGPQAAPNPGPRGGPDVVLSFYGGEPFLALDGVRRAVERGRDALGKRRLRVLAPTNGLQVRDEALAFCRDAGVELAVSIDGDTPERRFPDGRPATPALVEHLPELFAAASERGLRLLARMTVTPANVGSLASNVRMLARLGFRRIIYLPAFEEAWDDDAVAAWGREHRRIETWLAGARSAGVRVPELPGLRAVEERLAQGAPRRACGAGDRIAAVSTDGGLYPCYRLVFSDDPGSRLGDVEHGFTNEAAIARFAGFDPNAMRPEEGDCATCASRDGCTHACPALGFATLGDVAAVPAVACRLMCAQVEAVRPFARRARPQRRLVATAVAAAMTGTTLAAAACSSAVETTIETTGGGVCAVWVDSGTGGSGGTTGGGVCPVYVDSGTGGSGGTTGGGVCPVYVDSGTVEDSGGGGVCPVVIDSGGGLCDTDPDAGGGGVCPQPVYDGGGGLC